MKRSLAGILFAAVMVTATGPAFAETYTIDPRHTLVAFSVDRLGFSQTLGWFRDVRGEVTFDATAPESSSVNIVIETGSLDTNLADRDNWLRSDKMLNAEQHPKITFVSQEIEVVGENAGKVTGDLTLNGVTKPITLDVTFNKEGMNPIDKVETVGFSATGSLTRSEFGVMGFLGPLGDEVSIQIQLEAALPKSE